ncbi:UbiX family flavin prenyltransferase [Hydrogenoanaerobacterium sp.]|uniref:UbiX family flavin prenyltransferase n=1 Tax=Hydrogenoanaerobacterium sp. TaxID=2953763 RepID=UPI00289E9A70|nr:UbiX family flavin prenyltransferase [Hydrogenoanaerobacterium sp.]
MKRIIVGISGASGVWIGYRLLQILRTFPKVETHLVMTDSAVCNLRIETELSVDDVTSLAHYSYDPQNMGALIASGSFITDGMIVAPCSMKSLAGIACGYADNLLLRAADVCLKENRRVVLVPREMPLGKVHLRNLLTANELGCTIVPPMLTFYNTPQTLEDQVDHVLGKALLQFGLHPQGFQAWKGTVSAGKEGA